MHALLAQSSSSPVLRIIGPLTVVLVAGALLVMALAIVRRRMHSDEFGVARDFSLSDLRALHRDKKLTDEEFERAKMKLVGSVRSTLKREAKPSLVEKPFAEELKDS